VIGVIARRSLLFGMGKEILIQILIKGGTGVRLEFEKVYWITILIMNFLCIGYVFLLYCKDPDFCYKIDQYSIKPMLENDPEKTSNSSIDLEITSNESNDPTTDLTGS